MLLSPLVSAGQSFSIDDNPSASFGGLGFGAEDEFALSAGPGLAPSPSLGALVTGSDGTIISPAIGGLEHSPDGGTIDAFSTNHFRPALLDAPTIEIQFSVDRLTGGLPGSASAAQFALGQQPGDIYNSTAVFPNPATLVGTLGAGPFAGPLPSAGGGGSNTLLIDESTFGLTTAAGVVGPAAPGGPITPGSHDNVDAFDLASQVPDAGIGPPFGVYSSHSYFAIAPDEAVAVGASAADIFDTAAFSPGTAPTPFAPAGALGLDTLGMNTDSIDALVVFDGGASLGGPVNGGAGAEPGVDFALFSLAPGSASLGAFGLGGLSPSDVFFTDFTGTFGVFAFPGDLGLLPGAPGFPFQNQSNIDALEVRVPEPSGVGIAAVVMLLGAAASRGGRLDRAP